MNVSEDCINLIVYYEGCRLKAYPDPGSIDGNPWTIGYGHTGKEVKEGLVWTKSQAISALRRDIKSFELGVLMLTGSRIKQYQFDALVSFAFNIGLNAFSKSTLLKKFLDGDFSGAAREFQRWNKNGGKEMLGLTRRRASERALFEGKSYKDAMAEGLKYK